MSLPERQLEVVVKLSARERQLIRQYGYPFEKLSAELARLEGDRRDRLVAIDGFELGQLIGDLSCSTNRARKRELVEQLDALCELLEREERELRRRPAGS